jgi:hypothetical protein
MLMPDNRDWTWDECKDWFQRLPQSYELMLQEAPASVSDFDRAMLASSLESERNMVEVIGLLEKQSSFQLFKKSVTHNTLWLHRMAKAKDTKPILSISITWQNEAYHLFINLRGQIDTVDVALADVVPAIQHYLKQLN